jgi:hypothetical protein
MTTSLLCLSFRGLPLRRFASALGLLSCAAFASAQPDYNHDCTGNFADSIQFMTDYAANSPAADLNLDGRVNLTDFTSFSESIAPNRFTVYWMVTTQVQPNGGMDRQTDLTGIPIVRDCVMLYQQRFPRYPMRVSEDDRVVLEAGYHMMFRGVDGSYTSWESNLTRWLLEHSQSLPGLVNQDMPDSNFAGLVCLDWEEVTILRPDQDEETMHLWDDMVEQINSPVLNTAFAALSGWTIPTGVTRWADLTQEERVDYLNVSHRTIGLDFFITTVQQIRALRPNAKYSYYGLPAGRWLVYTDELRARNDELASLWAVLDVLSPSTYPLFWTTEDPSDSPCPDAVNSPGQSSAFFRSTMEEMRRVKQVYGRPEQQIVPYAGWQYKAQAGTCSGEVNRSMFVNDINLLHQLQLPWWFGADGVAIWGHYYRDHPHTPETVGADMRARWAGPIHRLSCPK